VSTPYRRVRTEDHARDIVGSRAAAFPCWSKPVASSIAEAAAIVAELALRRPSAQVAFQRHYDATRGRRVGGAG
jgi:hypothetical protein